MTPKMSQTIEDLEAITKVAETNTKFPGRPDYTGPTVGWFGLLHHRKLFEFSHNIMERVDYVRREKFKSEVATRLWNMIYIDPVDCHAPAKHTPLVADYGARYRAAYYGAKICPGADLAVKSAELYADYEVKNALLEGEIVAYIRSQIPDCAWNGKTLVFPVCKETT